jgi:hypothetical protein
LEQNKANDIKIYFVKLRPGYWESFVTTDADNAQLKLLENHEYVLEETELKEIDFEPENATYIGMLGSCAADLKFLKLENRLCFLPVYNKNYNHEERQWYQTVHKSDVPDLHYGVIFEYPEENFFGTVLAIKKP